MDVVLYCFAVLLGNQELVDQSVPIPVLSKEAPGLCFGGRIRRTEVAQMPKKPPKKKVKSKPKA
jgi:hypothetical protein